MKQLSKKTVAVNYEQCGDRYYAKFVIELKEGSGLEHGAGLKSKLEALAEGVEVKEIHNLELPAYTQVLEGIILQEVWEGKFNGKLVQRQIKRKGKSYNYLEDLNREQIQLPQELQEYRKVIGNIRIERVCS